MWRRNYRDDSRRNRRRVSNLIDWKLQFQSRHEEERRGLMIVYQPLKQISEEVKVWRFEKIKGRIMK